MVFMLPCQETSLGGSQCHRSELWSSSEERCHLSPGWTCLLGHVQTCIKQQINKQKVSESESETNETGLNHKIQNETLWEFYWVSVIEGIFFSPRILGGDLLQIKYLSQIFHRWQITSLQPGWRNNQGTFINQEDTFFIIRGSLLDWPIPVLRQQHFLCAPVGPVHSQENVRIRPCILSVSCDNRDWINNLQKRREQQA